MKGDQEAEAFYPLSTRAAAATEAKLDQMRGHVESFDASGSGMSLLLMAASGCVVMCWNW